MERNNTFDKHADLKALVDAFGQYAPNAKDILEELARLAYETGYHDGFNHCLCKYNES